VRVGIGFDAHRFTEGRPLMLGGVEVPFERGLAGHSDADVVLHALMDAMLGAGTWGDIGMMFPDDDEAYRGVSSLELLKRVAVFLEGRGCVLENADITVICQAPRISEHSRPMRTAIAAACGVEEDAISIKGKTTEGMGFTGRGEGIAAIAVALVRPL
jgi:2-C-methyl-D-erythritol 2,4-cyclodiphosphate synthase